MSNPSNDDTPSVRAKIDTLAGQLQPDDSGKLTLPDGVEADELLFEAAVSEKRRRDTQGSYTKGQQQLKALQVENEKLASSWEADAVSNLSNSEQARLEELKVQDPDAWRNEITELETTKRTQFQEKRETIRQDASQMTELERREQELVEFNQANPEFVIDDDVIQNDIPPRITAKLAKGEISFKDFLNECKNYVDTPKKIKGSAAPAEPNLSTTRGTHEPSPEAKSAQSSDDYSKEIF